MRRDFVERESETQKEMSLVDYASSDDDVSEAEEQRKDKEEPSPPSLPHNNPTTGSSSSQQQESAAQSSVPSIEKLPDASFLLNSPTISLVSGGDHASRVANAMAESASRKRESNGSASSLPRSKVPRGTLPHSRNVPDTVGGVLVPPQLRGRSNVVTEDISKLFVRRPADHHLTGGSPH